MTRKTAGACVATLALAALSGCGTIRNLSADPLPLPRNDHPRSVYGGVRLDAKAASILAAGHADPLALLLTLDLPFSAVGDTLTLPYVVWNQPQHIGEGHEGVGEQLLAPPSPRQAAPEKPASGVVPTAVSQPASP